MIQENELRYGNYIDCFGIKEVINISKNKIKVRSEQEGTITSEKIPLKSLSLKPIPITEEWLLKFGFYKFIGWDDFEFWRPKNFGGGNDFELMVTNSGFELPSGAICKFAHQLQNTYYYHLLTGEELTIKN